MKTADTPALPAGDDNLSKLMGVKPTAVLDGCLTALRSLSKERPSTRETTYLDRESKLITLYARAALAASGSDQGQISHSDPFDQIFSSANAHPRKKELALFLLRLLVQYPDVLKAPLISFRMFELLDGQLRDSLYRIAKLDPSSQTFEKQNALRETVSKMEHDLDTVVESLNSIESIDGFKVNFLKLLNSGTARLVIHPFIPRELRDSELQAIITAAREFGKTTGPELVPAYHRTQEVLAEFISTCTLAGTEYAGRFARRVAERLQEAIRKYFDSTPFSKPAVITIASSGKKYPLHTVDLVVPISVVISNSGDGFALDVRLIVRSATDNIRLPSTPLLLGGIEPGDTRVELGAVVLAASDSALIELTVEWKNADDTPNMTSEYIEITAQRGDVDWKAAGLRDPYSLSPVSTAEVLVGRDGIIDTLLALAQSADTGSAFIRGQKRVGKTSIAKTLQTRIRQLHPNNYIVTYLEAGDYIGADGPSTIERLGKQMCRAICRSDTRLKDLDVPVFENALSPLTEFLQEVTDRAPECRLLFILDEFDELPIDLYKRGAVGDAFFRTIRSVSNKPEFGFVLVGSEKMEYVLSCQGDSLNKFVKIPVDYFDKETQWSAFVDLIRRPASVYLEYSDSAVASLHEVSAGNPYFAKLICRSIYRSMIERRDSHVTEMEVEQGVQKTVCEIGANSFQHFWQDGIIDPPPRSEEISVRRAKVLLGLTECVRNGEACTVENVTRRARNFSLDEMSIEADLRSFERRKIIESRGGTYACKVELFERWLVAQGYFQILTTFIDQEELATTKQREELLRVTDAELVRLAANWEVYLGRRISELQISSWLSQFSTLEERRLMFDVLVGLRFYSTDSIRSKLREAHGIVTRGTTWQRKQYESTKRRDILVSYLGGPGHSGAEYARRYDDENSIHPDSIVAPEDIAEAIIKRGEVKAVVFIDDFIGTGDTLRELLAANSERLRALEAAVGDRLFLVVLCGLSVGVSKVELLIEEAGIRTRLHVLDTVLSSASIFAPESGVFKDEVRRLRARDVAYKYGQDLLPDWPLGYGNSEATIVFDNKIPNNCLPILWVDKKGWKPLFRRL
jgi:hypothetical protein